jgi:hypothetical protein
MLYIPYSNSWERGKLDDLTYKARESIGNWDLNLPISADEKIGLDGHGNFTQRTRNLHRYDKTIEVIAEIARIAELHELQGDYNDDRGYYWRNRKMEALSKSLKIEKDEKKAKRELLAFIEKAEKLLKGYKANLDNKREDIDESSRIAIRQALQGKSEHCACAGYDLQSAAIAINSVINTYLACGFAKFDVFAGLRKQWQGRIKYARVQLNKGNATKIAELRMIAVDNAIEEIKNATNGSYYTASFYLAQAIACADIERDSAWTVANQQEIGQECDLAAA